MFRSKRKNIPVEGCTVHIYKIISGSSPFPFPGTKHSGTMISAPKNNAAAGYKDLVKIELLKGVGIQVRRVLYDLSRSRR